MSAIFGVVAPSEPTHIAREITRMSLVMRPWGLHGLRSASAGEACFGQAVTNDTPEAREERLPRLEVRSGALITAEARLDNREELLGQLNLEPRADDLPYPDGDLVCAAYGEWGMSAPERLYGDWSFAAWHPRTRTVVLARDHVGTTALYYSAIGPRLAFASDIRALLQVSWVPRALDEIRIG